MGILKYCIFFFDIHLDISDQTACDDERESVYNYIKKEIYDKTTDLIYIDQMRELFKYNESKINKIDSFYYNLIPNNNEKFRLHYFDFRNNMNNIEIVNYIKILGDDNIKNISIG